MMKETSGLTQEGTNLLVEADVNCSSKVRRAVGMSRGSWQGGEGLQRPQGEHGFHVSRSQKRSQCGWARRTEGESWTQLDMGKALV